MAKNTIKSEAPAEYQVTKLLDDNEVIARALDILFSRMQSPGEALTSPETTKQFLQLNLADKKAECFAAVFLDNRHRVIKYAELFNGTIDGASVHPREVVRACIDANAAAVIFSHNHPSGSPDPSDADKRITKRLNDACQLIDVRVLDHIIVGGTDSFSFAEHGMI